MQVLDEFHEIPGLLITAEKNKVVKIAGKIEAWRDSATIFSRDLDLLWTNKSMSSGTLFNINNNCH